MSYKAKSFAKILSDKKTDEYLKEDRTQEKDHAKKALWYYGRHLKRKQADSLLLGKNVKLGTFLVRDSYSSSGDYVLSVRDGAGTDQRPVSHFVIYKKPGDSSYKLEMSRTYHSGLDTLIARYHEPGHGLKHILIKPFAGPSAGPPPPESVIVGRTNVLHMAIKSCIEENVVRFLNHPDCANVNNKSDEGSPATHLIVKAGMKSALQVILDPSTCHIFIADNRDRHGYTALHVAAEYGNHDMLKMLIVDGKCDLTAATTVTRSSAVHLAAAAGHLECVKVLLEHGAPDRPRDTEQKIPIEVAQAKKKTKVADYLGTYRTEVPSSLNKADWLQEHIDRTQAEDLINSVAKVEGAFIIRRSSKGNTYALSLCNENGVFHYQIKTIQNGVIYYIDDGPFHVSLEALVHYHSRFLDGLPSKLRVGISADGNLTDLYSMNDTTHYEQYDTDDIYEITEGGTYDLVATTPAPPKKPVNKSVDPLANMMINRKHIEIGLELGQGEYGTVYKGIYHQDGLRRSQGVAIKTLSGEMAEHDRKAFLQEARIMCDLKHIHIVKLVGICEAPSLMIIQELVKMGALLDYLWDYYDKVNLDTNAFLWAFQIATGMSYLETQNVVHRDLAARNILLASKNKVKISDFGLSRALNADSDYYQASRGGRWPVKWYAPESVNYGTFSHKSDVWSYGITLYEIYTRGDQPYGDQSGAEVIGKIEHGYRLPRPEDCPEGVYIVMKQCWEKDPKARPTFEMLMDKFLRDGSFQKSRTATHIKTKRKP